MEITSTDVYLSLGSNLGDKISYLKKAIDGIRENVGDIISVSSIYETPPWGFEASSSFLNLCLHTKTNLVPEALLERLKSIEQSLGRAEKINNGYSSRKIDIDIILFGCKSFSATKLHIPHPRFRLRSFVLQPLNDIAENYIDPITHLTITQLLANCPDQAPITCFTKEL